MVSYLLHCRVLFLRMNCRRANWIKYCREPRQQGSSPLPRGYFHYRAPGSMAFLKSLVGILKGEGTPGQTSGMNACSFLTLKDHKLLMGTSSFSPISAGFGSLLQAQVLSCKERSQRNTDTRKKLKTKDIIGSKSYLQLSSEKRNLETGEESDCIALWELTHTKNETWSNTESQYV